MQVGSVVSEKLPLIMHEDHRHVIAPDPGHRLPVRPDDIVEFRLAQLLLLLDTIHRTGLRAPTIERLGYYDFFAANPFLILNNEDDGRLEMILAGFEPRSLSYNSSAQRFTNRRSRLQHDLATLTAWGSVLPFNSDGSVIYEIADSGREFAERFSSMYARAYRKSAQIIVRRLSRLSDRQLTIETKKWLRAEHFMIDLFDDGV